MAAFTTPKFMYVVTGLGIATGLDIWLLHALLKQIFILWENSFITDKFYDNDFQQRFGTNKVSTCNQTITIVATYLSVIKLNKLKD